MMNEDSHMEIWPEERPEVSSETIDSVGAVTKLIRSPPVQILSLRFMGASYPNRLSFLRVMVRALHAQGTPVERPLWEIDAEGRGRALYTLMLRGHRYSLAAFSQVIDEDRRSDRVIADAWDATFVLCDGLPDAAAMERLEAQAPLQEAGRFRATELVLSRANRSGRIFDHTVNALASGQQPSRVFVALVGYLMRTTAVYGNGKFGLADRGRIASRAALSRPFAAEMLAVWLIREFSHDLVEHIAASRSPGAARLAPDIRRHLGIGNATGLGMAPFLVQHPVLTHRWSMARENAIRRVRSVKVASSRSIEAFRRNLARARAHFDEWKVDDEAESSYIDDVRSRLELVDRRWNLDRLNSNMVWNRVIGSCKRDTLNVHGVMSAIAMESYGDLVDDLCDEMADEGDSDLWDPDMGVDSLLLQIGRRCGWATGRYETREETARFWYLSEEKLEPRLGSRYEEPGADRELPMDIARQIDALRRAAESADPGMTVGALLRRHPEHRAAARRVQARASMIYTEVQESLIHESVRPLDMLRWKLSFFGATKFDPKSDLWLRVTLAQGAPTRHEIHDSDADDWAFPSLSL